jgi:hypothetical protein
MCESAGGREDKNGLVDTKEEEMLGHTGGERQDRMDEKTLGGGEDRMHEQTGGEREDSDRREEGTECMGRQKGKRRQNA